MSILRMQATTKQALLLIHWGKNGMYVYIFFHSPLLILTFYSETYKNRQIEIIMRRQISSSDRTTLDRIAVKSFGEVGI